MTQRVDIDGVAWPVNGAQVAVIDNDRVLVQLRPWPPGWELPGGHCEQDEDPAATAVREVLEETGLTIRVDALVGVYTWAGLRSAGDVVYRGAIESGRRRRSVEGLVSRFVTTDTLPRTAFPWMRQRVQDALDSAHGAAPAHRVQPVTAYHVAAFATAWLRAPVERLLRSMR